MVLSYLLALKRASGLLLLYLCTKLGHLLWIHHLYHQHLHVYVIIGHVHPGDHQSIAVWVSIHRLINGTHIDAHLRLHFLFRLARSKGRMVIGLSEASRYCDWGNNVNDGLDGAIVSIRSGVHCVHLHRLKPLANCIVHSGKQSIESQALGWRRVWFCDRVSFGRGVRFGLATASENHVQEQNAKEWIFHGSHCFQGVSLLH